MNDLLTWYTEDGRHATYSISVQNVVKNGNIATGTIHAVNTQNVADTKMAQFTYNGPMNTFELFSAPNVYCGENTFFTSYKNIGAVSQAIINAVR